MSDKSKKSFNEERWHDLLAKPVPPHDLQRKLQQNLFEQVNEEKSLARHNIWRWGLGISLAANILFAFIVVPSFVGQQDTVLLDMAYAHVQHEKDLEGHFVSDHDGFFDKKGIESPPSAFTVGLAKNCLIGLDPAKHMRLVSSQKNVVNLLIFPHQMVGELPVGGSGEKGSQRWLKLEPRAGVTTLAFYDREMPEQEVKQLVCDVFKGDSINISLQGDSQQYLTSI